MSRPIEHASIPWAELQAYLAGALADAVAYGVAEARGDTIVIDAYFAGPPPSLAPTRLERKGGAVQVIVRTREIEDIQPRSRAQVPYSGVHEGAAIGALIGTRAEQGAIAALLATAEGAPRPTHLLTCGHIFAPGAAQTRVQAAAGPGGSPVVIGRLAASLLDVATGDPRDVALVELTVEGATLALAGGPGPRLVDYLPGDMVFGRQARTYRPTRGAFDAAATTPGPFHARVEARLWPGGFDVDGVAATDRRVSSPGDSGTILATPDDIALGSCTGHNPACSLYEPIGRAIDALAHIADFKLWSKLP